MHNGAKPLFIHSIQCVPEQIHKKFSFKDATQKWLLFELLQLLSLSINQIQAVLRLHSSLTTRFSK